MQYILGLLGCYLLYRIWQHGLKEEAAMPDIREVSLYAGVPVNQVVKIDAILQQGKVWRIDITLAGGEVMKIPVNY